MSSQLKIKVVWKASKGTYVIRWFDRTKCPGGGWREISAKTANRKTADQLAGEHRAKLEAGIYRPPSNLSWFDFRIRYRLEKLSTLKPKTTEAFNTAANHLERLKAPALLSDVDEDMLSQFQGKLRRPDPVPDKKDPLKMIQPDGVAETTIAAYLRSIRAALGWAKKMKMIPVVPEVSMPSRTNKERFMRGKPVTEAGFAKITAACKEERPDDYKRFERYAEGLYLSGLRLEESLLVSWDDSSPLSINLSGQFPWLKIRSEVDKGNRDRLMPMAPEFARFLAQTPPAERRGLVFDMPYSGKRVSNFMSDIGRAAGVLVDPVENRYATAHDLRRSFGTRWARRVPPAVLQILMRHKTIETTMKYYVELNTDQVAAQIWSALGLELRTDQQKSKPQGDPSGDLGPILQPDMLNAICSKLFEQQAF